MTSPVLKRLLTETAAKCLCAKSCMKSQCSLPVSSVGNCVTLHEHRDAQETQPSTFIQDRKEHGSRWLTLTSWALEWCGLAVLELETWSEEAWADDSPGSEVSVFSKDSNIHHREVQWQTVLIHRSSAISVGTVIYSHCGTCSPVYRLRNWRPEGSCNFCMAIQPTLPSKVAPYHSPYAHSRVLNLHSSSWRIKATTHPLILWRKTKQR